MRTIYNCLILCHLNYGTLLWGSQLNVNDKLHKLKKTAARIITLNCYFTHSEPLYKQLFLLKSYDIYKCQVLKSIYKLVNKRESERARERESERARERESERARERESERARERESERARERESERARERESERAGERESERARERESERARERVSERARERESERARER